MKKIFFLTLLALFTFMGKTYAQNHLVATLDHEGTVSVFTGKDAFINAHEAAIDGDVITLSSGEFNATEITKAISLYGAGVLPYDSSTRLSSTDSLEIKTPLSTTKELLVEGIRFPTNTTSYDLNNATFRKCIFYYFTYRGGENGAEFIHCRFDYGLKNFAGHAVLMNCFVHDMYNLSTDTTYYTCFNCIIVPCYYNDSYTSLYNSIFTNSILYAYRSHTFDGSNSLFSCLLYESLSTYIVIERSSLMTFYPISDIFKSWRGGTPAREEDFKLTDEAKTTYIGNDGTEVGIYGGAMPYNPTPSVPRIKSFRMDAKPSEGILKADVEVE